MKFLKASAAALVAGATILGASLAMPTDTQAQSKSTPSVPVDVWALRAVVNAVDLSPDGKHVLVHTVPTQDGEYVLEVYKTEDIGKPGQKPVRRVNADPMEIISARWVSNEHIFGTAWQIGRDRVDRPEQDIRDYLALAYNIRTNKFNRVSGNFSIVNELPNEPNSVLIAAGNAVTGSLGVDPIARFRPRSYYRFNLNTGKRSLVLKGNNKFPFVDRWDSEGNPRFTQSLDRTTNTFKTYYRKPGDGSWTLLNELDADDPKNLYRILSGIHGIVGFKADDPNTGYMIDNINGDDTTGLYEFDFTNGQIGEKLAQVDNADIQRIVTHSIPGNDKMVAAVYPGDRPTYIWFDENEKALNDVLMKQIPYAHYVSITSRSVDGQTMVVRNIGPKDPGTFYLVRDGSLIRLGSRNPYVNQDQLADVKHIRFKARDGLEIPAYVTMPTKGDAPYPVIVQHNGGPHVNGMVLFDEMGQMLANAGYMVVHPENRISTGWGQKHFDAGYGQHGLAMQDDKDDAVKHLVAEGLADPDRAAFFGWSYGGYSALVAAAREDQLYQCSIAVAAVADAEKQYKGRRDGSLKALDEWSKRRGMIGINPINEVDKVNIPLLMVHAKGDRRVMYYHYKDYKKAFEKAGKQGQFVTLEDADHFGTTLMFDHQQQLYTKMLDFLANDCGPGGL